AANWQEALKNDRIKKVALANPKLAPYGAAAQEALKKAQLWEPVQPKLVNAQDIAISFQYASTSAVDAGFCALSVSVTPEGKVGCFFPIAQAPDIVQSACLLKRTTKRAAAEQFAAYLVSPAAQEIKAKFGYK
nr:molybdate ABC transporter substrate-binding protein [Deltaproteobacteria bacterium]